MLEETILKSFVEIGRDMFLRGLVSSHAGNMSIRAGERIYITATGTMTGRLKADDIVHVDLEDTDDPNILLASSELVVHRAIYLRTGARAVVHAHPPYATLLSMTGGELVPVDSEGSYHLKRVPIATPESAIASEEAAQAVSEYLTDHRIVLVRGHGSFARGDTLEDAYMLTSSLESSAFHLYHLEILRRQGLR